MRYLQEELEQKLENDKLLKTGNKYTIPTDTKGKSSKVDEYLHNGKRYVRVKANFYNNIEEFQLSNGEVYKNRRLCMA